MPDHEKQSPVIQLLDIVWRYATTVTGRSDMGVHLAMSDALTLAIRSGMPFQTEDFTTLMSRYSPRYQSGAWNTDMEPQYTLACQSRNNKAAQSYEHWVGRKPFITHGIVRSHGPTQGRLAVGDRFTYKIHRVKVTSFAKDGDYLTACTYKPQTGQYQPDKIDKRFKITRKALKP